MFCEHSKPNYSFIFRSRACLEKAVLFTCMAQHYLISTETIILWFSRLNAFSFVISQSQIS